MAFVPAPGYQPVYNPALPYRCPVYGGLRAGMSVYIQGTIHPHVNQFVVNFSCGQYDGADIALHFNPRFDGSNRIVLNTFQRGSWGAEEDRRDLFPFHRGQHFEIVFFVNPGGYQVTVNGSPFYQFNHRIPLERVETIHVDGNLTIQSLNIIGGGGGGMGGGVMPLPAYPSGNLPVMGGPQYNPPVPYYGHIGGGLTSKRTVVVRGLISEGATGFHINFKVGSSGDIALHFNARLNEKAVVRNSFLRGSWGHEEREMSFKPFKKGQYFDISIRCGNSRFKIYVNGQHFCDFKHRFTAFQMIDGLEIGGNVVLSFVQI
ncbi:galectin-4-like [Bombina bombina]|uniref:galectin-4-like n=1 Tax=Bombina bombina TaxID=8345 RepID=UPI00235B2CE2|nr:galectin-4-like [Bombina bombina]